MKQKAILTSLTTLALMAGSAAASASTTNTFTSTNSAQVLVTELAGYNGSINYTKANSDSSLHGNILSAFLTFNLQDDKSANISTAIDMPREWAKLTSVADGIHSLSSLPGSVEIESHPLTGAIINAGLMIQGKPQLSDANATIAANYANSIGAENFLAADSVPTPADYFINMDVTNLLKDSNSGVLNFGLAVDAKYADIAYSTNPASQFQAIKAFMGAALPNSTILMNEDYYLNHATLNVTYAPVPVPAAVWLFGSALAGLIGFRRKSV
ncbi:MAG: hypothetical protein RIR39_1638 [Pseudomonadota bacterium]